jgi:anti-anti-sigma factor
MDLMPGGTAGGAGSVFSVSVRHEGGTSFVAAVGELDMATVPELRAVLLDPTLCPGPGVVLDLHGLSFMDSMGISLLVMANREITQRGGALQVRCGPGPVSKVIAATKIDTVVHVVVDDDLGPMGQSSA